MKDCDNELVTTCQSSAAKSTSFVRRVRSPETGPDVLVQLIGGSSTPLRTPATGASRSLKISPSPIPESAPRRQRAYRQTEATALASEIRQRATQLVDIEKQVAGRITAAAAGIATTDFPTTDHQFAPRIQSVDQHTFKQDPPPPPGPPGDPFAGWTDEQMAQVATEIAHGHALKHFPDLSPRDLARLIYDGMKDPNTRVATSIDSGGLALLPPDGTVIFINPHDGDYGTAYRPTPTPTSTWRTPLEYFEQQTRSMVPIAPPTRGRLPPLTPGEMSPPAAPPRVEPPPAPRSAPQPKGGGGPALPGGPATPLGPHVVHPPHSIPHHLPILGEDDPWENYQDFQ